MYREGDNVVCGPGRPDREATEEFVPLIAVRIRKAGAVFKQNDKIDTMMKNTDTKATI